MRLIPFFALLITFNHLVSQTSSLTRINDPVVLAGTSLTNFAALTPTAIVGFKYVNGNWAQIPVQVDERAYLDIVTAYGPLAGTGGYLPPVPSASNPKIYFYCDPLTYVGADATSTFDNDDELVFMSKDAGGIFNGAAFPAGVVSANVYQVMIRDTMNVDTGYVYLFEQDGTLLQNAGINYVGYTSDLSATTGFPANSNSTNPENSTVVTSKYSWHFSSEWVSDELKINLGNGTDILDRHKAFFANGAPGCGRHEELFSAGENAFIINKAGPVRVLRSYMGAQSGPLTQRTHLFYEGRHDLITNLRVHAIPSIYDVFDYNSNANGMIYKNNFNPNGVTISGTPDVLTPGVSKWEQVTGTPGTLSIINRMVTTLSAGNATFSAYYDDNSTSPASNCTGTQGAWGTSGLGVVFASNICTDCYSTPAYFRSLETQKTIYADAPNTSTTTALAYSNQVDKPFELIVSAVQLTTGIVSAKNSLEKINLYPNPSTGLIIMDGLKEEEKTTITITNIYGQLIDQMTGYGNRSFSIKETGIYEITISSEQGIKTQKVIIIH